MCSTCMYVCMYVCISACMYVCVCVCYLPTSLFLYHCLSVSLHSLTDYYVIVFVSTRALTIYSSDAQRPALGPRMACDESSCVSPCPTRKAAIQEMALTLGLERHTRVISQN